MKKRILIVTDIHFCQEEYGGISRDEKAELLIKQIFAEYARDPFEWILFLGDYSLDHWKWSLKGSWLTHGKSYTKEFVDRFCGNLPAPFYMLAGNHEQFGEETWKEITGCSRHAEIAVDDFLFILWDSYGADLDPTEHSDGTYTPPNVAQIRAIMDQHPNKKVFLCSHYFKPNGTAQEIELIRDPRVICLFQGHTHKSNIITLPEEYGSKLLVQAGGWTKITPADAPVWGVRDLYLEKRSITSRYILTECELFHKGEAYKIPAGDRDEVEILL